MTADNLASELLRLFEAIDDGVCALDQRGNITRINRAAARILGYSADEVRGRNFHDVVHASEPGESSHVYEECPACRVIRTGLVEHRFDDVFFRKDRSSFHVQYASAPIPDDRSYGAVINFTDTTRRMAMQSQLDMTRRVASLSDLASNMAHEFNNVLMGIQPFTDVISRVAADNAKVQQAVERIITSIKRGKQFTDGILAFTRQSKVNRKPVLIGEWLEQTAQEARPLLGDAIEFRLEVHDKLVVDLDPGQFRQVLENLLANARDAMTGAGVVVLGVSRGSGDGVYPFGVVEHVEQFAHLTLADTGAGMSSEALSRAFEPLFATKRSATGLGLPVAYRIVQQHGGLIFAESDGEHGTSIHIFLPLSTTPAETAHAPNSHGLQKIRKLVLVEDDAEVAFGLTSILALEGIEVKVAETGAVATDVIDREQPDAVLLDLGLPDISGIDVYAAIAERWPKLPVIFSTGRAEIARIREVISTPHIRYLLKPYELRDLLDALKTLEA